MKGPRSSASPPPPHGPRAGRERRRRSSRASSIAGGCTHPSPAPRCRPPAACATPPRRRALAHRIARTDTCRRPQADRQREGDVVDRKDDLEAMRGRIAQPGRQRDQDGEPRQLQARGDGGHQPESRQPRRAGQGRGPGGPVQPPHAPLLPARQPHRAGHHRHRAQGGGDHRRQRRPYRTQSGQPQLAPASAQARAALIGRIDRLTTVTRRGRLIPPERSWRRSGSSGTDSPAP